jgi:hypothetical protein
MWFGWRYASGDFPPIALGPIRVHSWLMNRKLFSGLVVLCLSFSGVARATDGWIAVGMFKNVDGKKAVVDYWVTNDKYTKQNQYMTTKFRYVNESRTYIEQWIIDCEGGSGRFLSRTDYVNGKAQKKQVSSVKKYERVKTPSPQSVAIGNSCDF